MVPSEPCADKQPLHIVISEQLKQKIEAGHYEPGQRLPSEFDLGELFGVSRTTIRKAISNLIQQGLVSSQQGKGSFVSGHHKISISISNPMTHFDVALQEQGYVGQIQSLNFYRIQASSEVARTLSVSPAAIVYQQEKIIYADHIPIALEIDYFPESIGAGLTDSLQQGFTYSTLKANGIYLNAGKVNLGCIPATYDLTKHLTIPLGMPLLVLDFVAYADNSLPAVCGKVLSRSDWICYTSEITDLNSGDLRHTGL
ncbi:family transcriptional regulator [Leptolyngbya sp. Heron Island J]|uniref:GntR family transcriptional regulator n=1 Tax=Leptolyngbya sp. Heron Island J TaxID=1385935 RepID=UPI0003B9B413|nr:GntR family transcriptional regulator [Leptolyngbya sp. Heron Island J]ESA36458.1 family transcriptional regulator [Leptolyngbya sp. Heron Island J]